MPGLTIRTIFKSYCHFYSICLNLIIGSLFFILFPFLHAVFFVFCFCRNTANIPPLRFASIFLMLLYLASKTGNPLLFYLFLLAAISSEYYGLSEQSALFRFWVHPSFLSSSRSDHLKLLFEEIRNSNAHPCPPESVLKNGSFEQSTGERPHAWQLETWKKPEECPTCRFQTESAFAREGTTALFSKHADFNVSRWVQEVPVNPKTPYRLSGWIRTEGVSHSQTGAYLQVDAIAQRPWPAFGATRQAQFLGRTPELFNSSDWRYVEIVFRTRRDHKRVKVICGLGDFGAQVKGSAYFDMIQLRDLTGQYEYDLFSRPIDLN